MQTRENIRSISYLKSHAAQISEEVAATGAPVIITQNGEAAMVIEGVQQYQEKQELIALLKARPGDINYAIAGSAGNIRT